MFESVLLPAPFSPSSACTSPAATSRSTWSLATTPGNRFVMPWSLTAVMPWSGAGAGLAPAPAIALALRAADDSLHEPVDRVQLLHVQLLALRHAQLAALIVQRPRELVEGAVLDRLLLRG